MQYKNRVLSVAGAAALAAMLAACGGGGGSGNALPGGSPGSGTPSPSPSPTPTLSASGVVRDLGTHRYTGDNGTDGPAIAGSTVVVGPTLIVGATPPPTLPVGDAAATTAADGSYTVNGYGASPTTYVMVFPSSSDTSHVSLHGLAKITNNAIRRLYLYAPNAVDQTELSQINADRAANGASTVIFDELAIETARAHADFMGVNGYYNHCIPASNCYVAPGIPTTPPALYASQYASPNDLYDYFGGAVVLPPNQNWTENWAGGYTSWSLADAAFMAEKGQPNAEHFSNIVDPNHRWVGVGNDPNGLSAGGGPGPVADYLQEFYSPTGV